MELKKSLIWLFIALHRKKYGERWLNKGLFKKDLWKIPYTREPGCDEVSSVERMNTKTVYLRKKYIISTKRYKTNIHN